MGEATHNPSSFVTLEGTIGGELVLEDPLAADDVSTMRPGNKLPGAVGLKRTVLIMHGCKPGGIPKSGAHGVWYLVRGGDVGVARIGPDDANLEPRDYRV